MARDSGKHEEGLDLGMEEQIGKTECCGLPSRASVEGGTLCGRDNSWRDCRLSEQSTPLHHPVQPDSNLNVTSFFNVLSSGEISS